MKQNSIIRQSAYCEIVKDASIAVVLSWPGKEEECAQRPAAGATGNNLNDLLDILREETKNECFQRGKITITNASKSILYQDKDNRTEDAQRKINQPENLERLKNDLSTAQIVLCFGKKATNAVKQLNLTGKNVISAPHIGNKGLNLKYKVANIMLPSDRRKMRIKLLAKDILERI